MKGDRDVQTGSGQAAVGSYSSVINVSDTPAPSALPTPPPSSPLPCISGLSSDAATNLISDSPTATPSLSQYPHQAKKRKQVDEPTAKSQQTKQKLGQMKLSTFFNQPSSSAPASGSTQGSKTYQDHS